MIKKVGTFIAGFVVGTVAIYAWGQIFNKDADMEALVTGHDVAEISITDTDISTESDDGNTALGTEIAASDNEISSEAIAVVGQAAGSTVTVGSVNLDAGENGGWVVIHEIKNGVMANALGAVRKDSGVHSDIEVKLLRATVAGGTYAVVLYSDNGDRQFSMATDAPLKNTQGEFIMSTFSAK